MVVILARLFAEASLAEIDKVVYLTQGRVAPLYEPIEFGMAEKTIIKSAAFALGVSTDNLIGFYKKSGDLGEAIQKSKIKNQKYNSKIKINEVFKKLTSITDISGEGTVEKKGEILGGLLKELDPLSARYAVRIVLDKLRLGFSDMTVLEGLSWMIDGTKKHKDQIEAAYNVRPDLGFIAQEFKKFKRLKVQPKIGTPILGMRAERLTDPVEILEKAGPTSSAQGGLRGVKKMAIEPKLDGLRTQLHFSRSHLANQGETFLRLYSRGMEDVTKMYPDIVTAAENELSGVEEVILDGEAIGYDQKTGRYLAFQETVQRKRKYDVEAFSKNVPVKLVVFDVLFLNGKSFINEPYLERRKILEQMLKQVQHDSIVVPARMTIADRPEQIEKIFRGEVKNGLEGIMAKKLDGVYQAGARGWNWIKYKKSYETKLADTIDAVVMGLDFGQGKRNKFGVGAFLIGIYDDKTDTYKTVSKVGTGLTDDEWKQLAVSSKRLVTKEKPKNYNVNKIMDCDVWLTPKIVGEFRADELTKSPMHTAGYALRFPRLEKWREKKPEDTTTLQEILEMVKLVEERR